MCTVRTLLWFVVFVFQAINTLRPEQYGWYLPDNIFKYIFVNGTIWISITFWLKFVPDGPIDNNSALVQVMTWHRRGNKPLDKPMMVQFTDAYMRHPASMHIPPDHFSGIGAIISLPSTRAGDGNLTDMDKSIAWIDNKTNYSWTVCIIHAIYFVPLKPYCWNVMSIALQKI